jgi:CheY-like chemotaxis protein
MNINGSKYKNVLLIDDEDIDNFINERIMLSVSFAENIIVKKTAMSGLEYLKECVSDSNLEFPDIIFLDLNMPIMDGFAFLEEYDKIVSEYPQYQEKSRIIILSSSISPQDIDKASVNAHVFKYINKPLNIKYLEAINY